MWCFGTTLPEARVFLGFALRTGWENALQRDAEVQSEIWLQVVMRKTGACYC